MPLHYQPNHPLLAHNSLGIPARCHTYVEAHTPTQIRAACAHAHTQNLPIFVLGDGTNLVIAADYPGLVLRPRIGGIERLAETANTVDLAIGAGENWHKFVRWTLEQNLHGLENLALIPGSCGAAPVQNIGAYGVELAPRVRWVEYIEIASGQTTRRPAADCQFSYRDSLFKGDLAGKVAITRLALRLQKRFQPQTHYPALAEFLADLPTPPSARQVFQAVCTIRRRKLPDPATTPNAGSFFQNPQILRPHYDQLRQHHPDLPGFPQTDGTIKIPAAWLIDQLGWKGRQQNGIGIHARHALILTNPGHRRGPQVLEFAAQIAAAVRTAYGIDLKIEPHILTA
ncbi:MAG: UDP-N-acetylmuramate dehydrogenase [Cellvibrionales bacterium]|nr:UDP-N-acetylmuramate dehydrogenase [Cellvibrionales bacterium]